MAESSNIVDTVSADLIAASDPEQSTINAEQVSKCLTWENFSSLEDVHQLLDKKALSDELDNFYGADDTNDLAVIEPINMHPPTPKDDGDGADVLSLNACMLNNRASALKSPLDLDFLSAIAYSGAPFNTIGTATASPISLAKVPEQAISSAVADTTFPSLTCQAPTTSATTILSAIDDIFEAPGQHDEVNLDSNLAIQQAEDEVDSFIQDLLRPVAPRTNTLTPQINPTFPPVSSVTASHVNNDQLQPRATPLTPTGQAQHDALSEYIQATSPECWAGMSSEVQLDIGLDLGSDPEDMALSQVPDDFRPEALALLTPGPSFDSNSVEAGFYQNVGPHITPFQQLNDFYQGWQPNAPFQLAEPFQYNPGRAVPNTPTRAPKSRTPQQLPTPHRTPKASNQDRIKKPRAKISALPGQAETIQNPLAKKTQVRRRAKNTAAEASDPVQKAIAQEKLRRRNQNKELWAMVDAKAAAAGLQTKGGRRTNSNMALAMAPNGTSMDGSVNAEQTENGWLNMTPEVMSREVKATNRKWKAAQGLEPVSVGNMQRQKRKRDESEGYGVVEGGGVMRKKAKVIEIVDLCDD